MVITQGDIFWAELGTPRGSAPGYRHPYVVVQNDLFNKSTIQTVVMCALASNLVRAGAPGNVRLVKGEANLSKPSVINISQLVTIDKHDLVEKIGTLSKKRVLDVLDGLELLLKPRSL